MQITLYKNRWVVVAYPSRRTIYGKTLNNIYFEDGHSAAAADEELTYLTMKIEMKEREE